VRIVVALGGNALLRRGEPADAETQRRNVAVAAAAVADLARSHQVVVTHGNGPQVGLLALQAEAYRAVKPYPLDVLGAESEGMVGYLLEQALLRELPGRECATLLTQVIVDAGDRGLARPTKPVGPLYGEQEALELANERGWTVAPDGEGWRRVVPSPEPLEIVELRTIRLLADAGVVVICAGGGGVPVVADEAGGLRGVEAVVDKDLAAALLARLLHADMLLMLTDVPAVERAFGTPAAEPIRRATPVELRGVDFAAGSMAPKVEAACRFVDATGGTAAIGALADASAIVRGEAGTVVTPGPRV
jgi:carbamate kinase